LLLLIVVRCYKRSSLGSFGTNAMKKLLLAIALVSLVAAPSLHATRYPHLMPLWSEVVSQQAGSPDKPTGTALRKARTTLEQ
jgi:hypothetical protein